VSTATQGVAADSDSVYYVEPRVSQLFSYTTLIPEECSYILLRARIIRSSRPGSRRNPHEDHRDPSYLEDNRLCRLQSARLRRLAAGPLLQIQASAARTRAVVSPIAASRNNEAAQPPNYDFGVIAIALQQRYFGSRRQH
jgi:hypothetical protein